MRLGNIRAKKINESPPVRNVQKEQRQEYLVASRLFTVEEGSLPATLEVALTHPERML